MDLQEAFAALEIPAEVAETAHGWRVTLRDGGNGKPPLWRLRKTGSLYRVGYPCRCDDTPRHFASRESAEAAIVASVQREVTRRAADRHTPADGADRQETNDGE